MRRKVIPILILLMSAYWFYEGWFTYGVWRAGGPGGGFMPVFSSVLAAIFAVVMLVKGDTAAKAIPISAFIPVVMVAFALTLSVAIGLLPALTLALFVWIWRLERYPLGKSVFITACPMLVVYGVFRLWLQVPFPTGMLFGG